MVRRLFLLAATAFAFYAAAALLSSHVSMDFTDGGNAVHAALEVAA